jgi:hypothetical protein
MDAIAAPTNTLDWVVAVLAGLTLLTVAFLAVCLVGSAIEWVRSRRPSAAARNAAQAGAVETDELEPNPVDTVAASARPFDVAMLDDDVAEPADMQPATILDGEVGYPRQPLPLFRRPADSAVPLETVPAAAAVSHDVEDVPRRVSLVPPPEPASTGTIRLPAGAEAALNAISELFPDPRNVVVTHRDPTGEVLITRPSGELADVRRGA